MSGFSLINEYPVKIELKHEHISLRAVTQCRVIRRFWASCPQGHARLLPSLLDLLGTMKEESVSF